MNSLLITQSNPEIVSLLNERDWTTNVVFITEQVLKDCQSIGFNLDKFLEQNSKIEVFVGSQLITRQPDKTIDEVMKEIDLEDKKRKFHSDTQREREESIRRQLDNIKLQMEIDKSVTDPKVSIRQDVSIMLQSLHVFRISPNQTGIGENVTLEPGIDEDGRQEIQSLILKKLRQL